MERLLSLLRKTYRAPISVKSDLARSEADVVAMAASMQLITTRISPQRFAQAWRITTKGLSWLNEKDE